MGSLEIVSPWSQRIQYGGVLRIIHVVVVFRRGVFSQAKVDGSEKAETLGFVRITGNCEAACIHQEDDRLSRDKVLAEPCFCECHLDSPK